MKDSLSKIRCPLVVSHPARLLLRRLTTSRNIHPLEWTIFLGPNSPLCLSRPIYPFVPHSTSFCERYMHVLPFPVRHRIRVPYRFVSYPCTITLTLHLPPPAPDFAEGSIHRYLSRNPFG